MPRYLQKLVGRAGVAPLPASLYPAGPARAQESASGPFQEVEYFRPESPAPPEPEARVAPLGIPPPPPRVIEFGENPMPPVAPVVRELIKEHVVQERVGAHILPSQESSPDEMRAELPVQVSARLETPGREPRLAPDIEPKATPLVTVISRPEEEENATQQVRPSESLAAEKHSTEQDVLSRLMPRLEAWFRQPSPAQPQAESHEPEPPLGPSFREPESPPPLRREEPRLVVGQIHVDVVQAAAQATAPVPPVVRILSRSAQSHSAAGTIAKLGFGLGQM
jgi:hypothetical protein